MPAVEEGIGGRVRVWWRPFEARDGFGLRAQLWVFAAVMVLLATRRPGLFLHPQFYAEDGAVWYADAYNYGWLRSLARPESGYLSTVQRLLAGVTLLLPFRLAPVLMNLMGMIVQALPVTALLSRRCRTWGSLETRLLMAAIYVAVPNADEIHVVLTNSQWHLALLAVLIAFGAGPERWWGHLSDIVLFLVFSVSGPFPLVLLPLVLVFWWFRRQAWSLVVAGWMLPGTLLQAYILHTTVRMAPMPLGATPALLLRIVGADIFVNAMAGSNYHAARLPLPLLAAVVLFALAVIAFGCWRGGISLTLFAVFSMATLASSLKSPLIAGPGQHAPLWELLMTDLGGRYWFYPMMVFLWSSVVAALAAERGARWFRYAGRAVLVVMLFGVVRQWVYRPYKQPEFAPYAAAFERMQPGQTEVIPIYPEGTTMTLIKR